MLSKLESYNRAVNFLYDLQKHGIKLGLENPIKLLALLGEPHQSFLSVHIAGTNGKGSTAAILASILRENNFRVGLFSSPHLASFTERIKINNIPITEDEVIHLTSSVQRSLKDSGIQSTFFEFVTAMAFSYFAREKVDWAVIEVGMGGRFDATNVITPVVSIITNIGFDHREFLGNSISDIAREKAGIIKDSVPTVTATWNPEALSVIKKTAENRRSSLYAYPEDFRSTLLSMDSEHIAFDYMSFNHAHDNAIPSRYYKNLSLPLTGRHQMINASLAIRACEVIEQRGFSVSEEALRKGLDKLTLKGRFEKISQKPPFILDSAHNPEAAQALARTVRETIPEHEKIIIIIGILNDKDIEGILKPLSTISDTFIFTKPRGERAAPPEKLRESLIKILIREEKNPAFFSLSITHTVEEALRRAEKILESNYLILVTGSFYTTGEVKELLGKPGMLPQLRE